MIFFIFALTVIILGAVALLIFDSIERKQHEEYKKELIRVANEYRRIKYDLFK